MNLFQMSLFRNVTGLNLSGSNNHFPKCFVLNDFSPREYTWYKSYAGSKKSVTSPFCDVDAERSKSRYKILDSFFTIHNMIVYVPYQTKIANRTRSWSGTLNYQRVSRIKWAIKRKNRNFFCVILNSLFSILLGHTVFSSGLHFFVNSVLMASSKFNL